MNQKEWIGFTENLNGWALKNEADGIIALKNSIDNSIFAIHAVKEIRNDGLLYAFQELDTGIWLTHIDSVDIMECLNHLGKDGYYFGWEDLSCEEEMVEIGHFLQEYDLKIAGAFLWIVGDEKNYNDLVCFIDAVRGVSDPDEICFQKINTSETTTTYHIILTCRPDNTI